MRVTQIKSCYIGPVISPEQFIAEHFFLYLTKGTMNGFDGNKLHVLKSGEYCLVRKNHLARYNKEIADNGFEKVIIIFDEPFLKKFQAKHKTVTERAASADVFLRLKENELIPDFIRSLIPYYNRSGKVEEAFADLKREELLLILLKLQPELSGILFDFGKPEKINLEEFINRNYKFNVSLERLAFLTGRSLSAFKRDFKEIFHEAPSRWLVQKRLQEAHFLITKMNKKPSEIYLDLGFEDLSHFSYAFKKNFGLTPTALAGQQKMTGC